MQSAIGKGGSLYALAALVGAFFFFSTFGFTFVTGVGGFWGEGQHDLATQIVGLRYFLAEPWHFPLFDVKGLLYPSGTNIIYTDSIPIVALMAKLFVPALGPGINPYGVWVMLCWVLQPVAAVYALRSAGVTAPLPIFCVAVISLFVPAWLRRFGHIALCGHFFLLTGIGMYFRARAWNWPAMLAAWAVLLALVLLVHPYLMVMCLALFGAALLRYWRGTWRRVLASIPIGLAVLCVLIGVMYASGHISSYGYTGGFGTFSMNLASPFWPQRSGLFPLMTATVDATGGQYEGYNYLGAGLLGLFGTALIVGWRSFPSGLRWHWPLLLVLAGLFALALSNKVYFFDQLLLELGKVPDFMQQIRATGRFFWPIAYAMLICGAAAIAFALGPRAGVVLAVLMGLQAVDASPSRIELAGRISKPIAATIDAQDWRELIDRHEAVFISPSFVCAPPPITLAIEQLIFAASASATPVNSAYLARVRSTNCAPPLDARLADGVLVIAFSLPLALATGDLANCRILDGAAACSARWEDVPSDLRGSFSAFDVAAYALSAGEAVSFEERATGYRFLGSGWLHSEPWGVWAGAGAAEVGVVVPGQAGERARLDFGLSVRAAQRVGVYADGVLAATWDFTAADLGPDCCTRSVTVPTSAAPLVLEFRVEPSAAGEPDPRPLVIGLKSLTREAAP